MPIFCYSLLVTDPEQQFQKKTDTGNFLFVFAVWIHTLLFIRPSCGELWRGNMEESCVSTHTTNDSRVTIAFARPFC